MTTTLTSTVEVKECEFCNETENLTLHLVVSNPSSPQETEELVCRKHAKELDAESFWENYTDEYEIDEDQSTINFLRHQ